jgi:hypothetical protein
MATSAGSNPNAGGNIVNFTILNAKHQSRAVVRAGILLLVSVSAGAQSQQPKSIPETGSYASGQVVASVRHGLAWQRTSPTVQQPDGPVLYQLIFNAGGVPGTVPVFDTNPRHLSNSPITVSGGNLMIGGGNGLIINGATGIINFANGQTFPAVGVNSVTAGNAFITIGGTAANPTVGLNTGGTDARYLQLSGGTMTGNITFAGGQTFPFPDLAGEVTGPPATTVVSNAVSTNTANAIVRRDGSGNFAAGTVSLSGNLALPFTNSAGTAGVITLGGSPFLQAFGSGNTFVGGSGNFMLGPLGSGNTAVGFNALHNHISGQFNDAFGFNALLSVNTFSNGNAAFGSGALSGLTGGDSNIAMGRGAGATLTTGGNNIYIGADAAAASESNTIRIGNGGQARMFTSGVLSPSGGLALPDTTGAGVAMLTLGDTPFLYDYPGLTSKNTFVGASAGNLTMTGVGNTAVGARALAANGTGAGNAAFGTSALIANTTGGSNSAFGNGALSTNTDGSESSAFGNGALTANTRSFNSAFGSGALFVNNGFNNSAFGAHALLHDVIGSGNSAFGFEALTANAADMTGGGLSNSAFGDRSLTSNMTGSRNSAFGSVALSSNTNGSRNTALGWIALILGTGSSNVAVGANALGELQGGNNNIAVGDSAGGNLTGNDSNNIEIGNFGIAGDSNVIRIGTVGSGEPFTQTAAFIAGISGATVTGVPVLVSSSGQLGVASSSQRVKDGIADLGGESDVLMKLRPVAFYYKPELDSTHTRQYGLVAEEVAAIAPNLVVFDEHGSPQTVRYHFVNAMLLNEVQKQHRLIEAQQNANEALQKQLIAQEQRIDQLNAMLQNQQTSQQAEMVSLREEIRALCALLEKSGTSSLARLAGQR